MIKAVVLDIDGVIVGTKKGINLPNPDPRVCQALRKVHESGIPVVFVTAKTSFAASKNIKFVGIDNPHIADSGAVLFNPVRGEFIDVKSISPIDISHIISSTPNNMLINLFTAKDYYVLKKLQEKYPEFVKKYGDF
ncbi:MAG: HAD hydrolase family protein, partial [Candidatus Levybacteria bacterium]|nr:HAD hydrolase family protein [Candidatus Levybacteria bacterium]